MHKSINELSLAELQARIMRAEEDIAIYRREISRREHIAVVEQFLDGELF